MGPELMAGLAIASAAATATGAVMQNQAASAAAKATEQGALAQAQIAEQQAAKADEVAKANQAIAGQKALEERAAAQRAAGEELRTARLAQSRLGAVAGASGSGTSDPTVMQMFGSIEKEGRKNADIQTAAGEQRAQSISYQAALDRWTSDANSAIVRQGAANTVLGGSLQAQAQRSAGQAGMVSGFGTALGNLTSMGIKYGSRDPQPESYRFGSWRTSVTR